MARITHFEIHGTDPHKLIQFYQAAFGWDFPIWLEEPPYWGAVSAAPDSSEPGINGGLMVRKGEPPAEGAPVNAFVCTVEVSNFDKTEKAILDAGGTVAVPKQAINGFGWQGYYKDPDGNIFGVHQSSTEAR